MIFLTEKREDNKHVEDSLPVSDDSSKGSQESKSDSTSAIDMTSFHENMKKLSITDFDDPEKKPKEETPTNEEEEPQPQKKNIDWKKTILRCVVILLTVLGCVTCFYVGYTINHANQLLDNSYKALPTEKDSDDDLKLETVDKPISILIMGIDNTKERHLSTTRTDSMIVCTYNPKNGDTSMVSIPRDTYVTMKQKNYNTTGKINSAYSIAQEEGTIDAVEKLLDIPIDYYVRVDFDTLEDVVNAFGGIYIDVPFNLTEQDANGKMNITFKEGKHQLLNGEEALAFSRTRHIDDDIQRGKRQQEVIGAIVNRAMESASLTKYAKVLQTLNGHIKTNMPRPIILGLASEALKTGIHITNYTFDWSGFTYNGESFVALKKDSLAFIRHRLRVQLGLDKPDKRDEKSYKFHSNGEMDPNTYPAYDVEWDS